MYSRLLGKAARDDRTGCAGADNYIVVAASQRRLAFRLIGGDREELIDGAIRRGRRQAEARGLLKKGGPLNVANHQICFEQRKCDAVQFWGWLQTCSSPFLVQLPMTYQCG